MSVGHLARVLEEAGVPTVMIGVRAFRPRLETMQIPRLLITHHPMGRTLGAPGDRERQRAVILSALALLDQAERGGTIAEFAEPYHPHGGNT